jgi:hypothetical protein
LNASGKAETQQEERRRFKRTTFGIQPGQYSPGETRTFEPQSERREEDEMVNVFDFVCLFS